MAQVSMLAPWGVPIHYSQPAPKPPAGLPFRATGIWLFDVKREGYANASVVVYRAGTTQLATLFADEGMTTALPNPQILASFPGPDGTANFYGRWAQPVYTPYAFTLKISGQEESSVHRPAITDLAGETADDSFVTALNASRARRLDERFADNIVALDFGTLTEMPNGSPLANTRTLTNAIGAAAAQGGGNVYLPPGDYEFLKLNLPEKVRLVGAGTDATVLVSRVAEAVITVTGKNAGLTTLTLDGLNLNAGSIGIYGLGQDSLTLTDAVVKRFQKGIKNVGGVDHRYTRLTATNCGVNVECLGDENFSQGGGGNQFADLIWQDGECSLSTEAGLRLFVNDAPVRNNVVANVLFDSNIGLKGAIDLFGGTMPVFRNCTWSKNSNNMVTADAEGTLPIKFVTSLQVQGGRVSGGTFLFDGSLADSFFEGVQLTGCTFNMNVPDHPILLVDCAESATVISGETTLVIRAHTELDGTILAGTTTAAAIVVYHFPLDPGDVVEFDVSCQFKQTNGVDYKGVRFLQVVRGAPSVLTWDSQTQNFTVGNTVLGATSHATGIISAMTDTGANGTLSLVNIGGAFINNELLSETNGSGNGRVVGALVPGLAATLTTTTLYAQQSSAGANAWACNLVVIAQEAQIIIQGEAAKAIEYHVTFRIRGV